MTFNFSNYLPSPFKGGVKSAKVVKESVLSNVPELCGPASSFTPAASPAPVSGGWAGLGWSRLARSDVTV